MPEIKLNKNRRKKGATDDVAHGFGTMATSGHAVSNRLAGPAMRGEHTMNGARQHDGIDDDERRRMIAEAAYYRALRRGFANGSPESDWLEAEAEIVALLANAGLRS